MPKNNTPIELVKTFDTSEVVTILQVLSGATLKKQLEIAKNLLLKLYQGTDMYHVLERTPLNTLYGQKVFRKEFSNLLCRHEISTNRDERSESVHLLESRAESESESESEYLLVCNGKILTSFSSCDTYAHIENCLIAAMKKELKQLKTRYKKVKMYYPRSACTWVGTAIKVCNDGAIKGYTLENNLIMGDDLMIPTDILRKYARGSGRVSTE